jgi:hypothetical protein
MGAHVVPVTTHKMAEAHETWLAKVLHGRKSRGSGSQWRDQMDGRRSRYHWQFAWAWDGKSTLGKSISVTRKMLSKAREQAGGERPMIPLRFYSDERLRTYDDWFLVRAEDFLEMDAAANDND